MHFTDRALLWLFLNLYTIKRTRGNIKNLKQGDRLILTDIYGNSYVYEVVITEILSPYNVSEMINGKFDLTLYTCTYDNQNRVTVRLNKVENWELELK